MKFKGTEVKGAFKVKAKKDLRTKTFKDDLKEERRHLIKDNWETDMSEVNE